MLCRRALCSHELPACEMQETLLDTAWVRALQEVPNLEGLVVIDVVEGTAIASLPHMSAILSNRPPSFPSLQVALEWARHTGVGTRHWRDVAKPALASKGLHALAEGVGSMHFRHYLMCWAVVSNVALVWRQCRYRVW